MTAIDLVNVKLAIHALSEVRDPPGPEQDAMLKTLRRWESDLMRRLEEKQKLDLQSKTIGA